MSTDGELRFENPKDLVIDELNERRSSVGPRNEDGVSIEDSIGEEGVQQPVIAREVNGELHVVAGQRRTLAAQAQNLDEIKVIVEDLDDADALVRSITENDEGFKKSVSRADRAVAVKELVELVGSRSEAARRLGRDQSTISRWLEPVRGEWAGTIFDPDVDADLEVEQLSQRILEIIRGITDGGERGEEIGKKILRENITQKTVRLAAKEADGPDEFEQLLDELSQKAGSGHERVQEDIVFTEESAEALRDWAKSRGTNEREAVRILVEEKLEDEGYL
jgi:ParB/RepB/Spo0J family partition protein